MVELEGRRWRSLTGRTAMAVLIVATLASTSGCTRTVGKEAPPAATSSTKAQPKTAPTPTPTPTPDKSCLDKDCQFGQTTTFQTRSRHSPNIPLEVTVSEPIPFKPSKEAELDAKLGHEKKQYGKNVYFVVTMHNASKDVSYGPTVSVDVERTPDDYNWSYVSDGDIGWAYADEELKPGATLTRKYGFSVTSTDTIKVGVSIDGLNGTTLRFSRDGQ